MVASAISRINGHAYLLSFHARAEPLISLPLCCFVYCLTDMAWLMNSALQCSTQQKLQVVYSAPLLSPSLYNYIYRFQNAVRFSFSRSERKLFGEWLAWVLYLTICCMCTRHRAPDGNITGAPWRQSSSRGYETETGGAAGANVIFNPL